MIIGTFRHSNDGYEGRIHTLGFDAAVTIARAPFSEVEGAPAWKVFLGDPAAGIEIGAGRFRSGSRGIYLALQIDDPLLAAPLTANLHGSDQRDGEHWLIWSRPDAHEKD
ncbi:DUF736 domain-containing protein [Sphingopyxis sp. YF1]|nr:DUF736 domain-containing protein [Sphingopyxis sp. YF1]